MHHRCVGDYLLLLILLSSVPTSAQTDPFAVAPGPVRLDLSGSKGLLLSTDWSDLVLLGSVSTVSGTVEQVLVRDLVIDPGPVVDAVVTYWEGRYGFRVHGGFARSCLAVGRRCGDAPGPAGQDGIVRVDAWMYDVGGAIGLVDYVPGRWVWPYVFIGFGAVTYNLERAVGPPLTFIEHRPTAAANNRVIIAHDNPQALVIAIDELGLETKLALNVGVTTDLRLPIGAGSVGLRLELSDHIHRSPIDVRIASPEAFTSFARDTRLDFGYVHNMRAAAGLVVQFGR